MWQVRIFHDRSLGSTKIYIFEISDQGDKILRTSSDGPTIHPLSSNDRNESPTLEIPWRFGTEVLQAFAEELHQLGYGGTSSLGELKALQMHINSLEKIVERQDKLLNKTVSE